MSTFKLNKQKTGLKGGDEHSWCVIIQAGQDFVLTNRATAYLYIVRARS